MEAQSHFLNLQQRSDLRRALKQQALARMAYRINTILLMDEGYSVAKIAKLLFLDENSVRTYAHTFSTQGIDALLSDDYKGKQPLLTSAQESELYQYASSMIFRTVSPLILFVEEKFHIRYSASGMRDLLHRIGMTYKKASLVPGKADPEEQEKFLERLEALMQKKSPETPVYFADGCHPTHNPTPSYGWIPKGKRAEVPANSGRQRVNLNGAINAETHAAIVFDSDCVNAQSTIELLQRIEANHPDAPCIYVLLDNASYNRAKVLREYVESSRICLIYLPTYSPNLNLIERLWRLMHMHVTDNRYYEKFKDFREELLMFFNRLSEDFSESLTSLLTLNFHISSSKETRVQAAYGC